MSLKLIYFVVKLKCFEFVLDFARIVSWLFGVTRSVIGRGDGVLWDLLCLSLMLWALLRLGGDF